jgi:hypothetical protein
VLTGDSVHCFGDGVLIASAFVADLRLGAIAALAVLAHEVPHHMGDLVVLRQGTAKPRHAVIKLLMTGSVTVLGGLLGFTLIVNGYNLTYRPLDHEADALPYGGRLKSPAVGMLLPVFAYVACSYIIFPDVGIIGCQPPQKIALRGTVTNSSIAHQSSVLIYRMPANFGQGRETASGVCVYRPLLAAK